MPEESTRTFAHELMATRTECARLTGAARRLLDALGSPVDATVSDATVKGLEDAADRIIAAKGQTAGWEF